MYQEERDVRNLLRDKRAELRRTSGGHEIWFLRGVRLIIPCRGRKSGDAQLWKRVKSQVFKASGK